MQNYQPELNFELIERIYLFAQRTKIIAVKFVKCIFEFFNTVYTVSVSYLFPLVIGFMVD